MATLPTYVGPEPRTFAYDLNDIALKAIAEYLLADGEEVISRPEALTTLELHIRAHTAGFSNYQLMAQVAVYQEIAYRWLLGEDAP